MSWDFPLSLITNSPMTTDDFKSAPNITRTDKDFSVKEFYTFTDIESTNKKGQKFARTAFTGSVYSSTLSDYLIAVTSLSTTVTIGLPRPKLAGVGKTFQVKDEVGGAATTTIVVVSQGEETIDGSSSFLINVNYECISFYTDGANWFIY